MYVKLFFDFLTFFDFVRVLRNRPFRGVSLGQK